MKILPPEPNVDLYNEGFGQTDILQRKKVGNALTDLLERIDDPLVVALDGQWGTGKTYFLKRWIGAHTLENGSTSTTIYFDSFAHDYLSDPLPALVSALTERLSSGSDINVQRVKEAAFKLAKPLARVGLAIATFGATEALGEMGEVVAEAASGESAKGLEKFWEEQSGRSTAMAEFKDALETLARPSDEGETGSSLVFVIDELDRCRPDYALEVLEVIKHFFAVPHVHFVLGVNLRALENSVKVSYGKNIDAQAYLRKFIHITLDLPMDLGDVHQTKPANLVYLTHLIKEMGVPDHIAEPLRSQVELVSRFNEISIRDIGKIVSSLVLASNDVLKRDNILPGWILVMIDLVIAKNIRPDLYPKFLNANVNQSDLLSYIGASETTITEVIDGDRNPEYEHEIYWRYLTWLYLTQNGKLENVDTEFARAVGRQFDQFGLSEDARKLPMKVHLRWLDQFSFYVP